MTTVRFPTRLGRSSAIRGIGVAVSLALAAPGARSTTIDVLSTARYVTISGTADADPYHDSFFEARDFSGTVGGFSASLHDTATAFSNGIGGAPWAFSATADSRAVQTSSVGAGGISFDASVWAGTGSLSDFEGDSNAWAESFFKVVFQVPDAALYRFSYQTGEAMDARQLTLSSLHAGELSDGNAGVGNESGWLLPGDTYTLTGFMRAHASGGGTLGYSQDSFMSAALAVTPGTVGLPDSGGILGLLGLSAAALLLSSRRLSRSRRN